MCVSRSARSRAERALEADTQGSPKLVIICLYCYTILCFLNNFNFKILGKRYKNKQRELNFKLKPLFKIFKINKKNSLNKTHLIK